MDAMLMNNQNQVPQPKEPTKPPSKKESEGVSYSSRDGLSERLSNLAEKKKSSVPSKSSKKSSSTKKPIRFVQKKENKTQYLFKYIFRKLLIINHTIFISINIKKIITFFLS